MIAIKIYLLCWFFTNFEPLTKLIDKVFLYNNNKYLELVYEVLSCQYCLTFWTTLIITLNPFFAIGLAMIAQTHKKLIK